MKSRVMILILISLIHVFGSDKETNKTGSKQKFFKHQNIYNDPQKVQDFLAFKDLFKAQTLKLNGNECANEDAKETQFDVNQNVSESEQKSSTGEEFNYESAETLQAEDSQKGTIDAQAEKQEDENIGEWKTTFSEIIKSWREESDASPKFDEGQFGVFGIDRHDPLSKMNSKLGIVESYETPERLFTANSDDFHTQIKTPKAKHEMHEKDSFTKTLQGYSTAELNDEKRKETFNIPNSHFPPNEQNFKKQMKEKNESVFLYDNSMNVECRTKIPRHIKQCTCRLCDGYIHLGQPHIGCTNNLRGHAICLAGYGGERYEFYPRQKAEGKPNSFGKCLLDIFKDYRWLNTYYHMDFIWEELEKRMEKRNANSYARNEYYFVSQMRLLNFKIAHWHEEFKGKTVHWYIHRENWQQPEYVNWQTYITEILKAKHTIPVVNFSYSTKGVKPIIPPKLLDFIKQYTKCASFEEAVIKHMLNVEIFHQYNDMDGMLVKLMRLKNEPKFGQRPSRQETSRLFKEKERGNIQIVECNLEFDEQRKNENFNIDDNDNLFEFNIFRDSKQSSPIKNPSKI